MKKLQYSVFLVAEVQIVCILKVRQHVVKVMIRM